MSVEIRIELPQTPEKYRQVYDLVALHYDWSELLCGIEFTRDEFPEWARRFTWLHAVWVNDKLAGYILLRGMENGEGEVHVCRMPGACPRLTRIAWNQWKAAIMGHIHTIHAYIPENRARLAKMAGRYGFQITKERGYYHGRYTETTKTG